MLKTIRRVEYVELVMLFFIQGAALATWLVPLSNVLDSHGYRSIRPFAFAASATAAFFSPLVFGAIADRHASPVKVLRWLALATAIAMMSVAVGVHYGWNRWLVLALIQLQALGSAPSWSIASSIVFARLADAQAEFGPIRAMATLGWMGGCWLVSALGADASPLATFSGSLIWLAVSAFTFFLPPLATPKSVEQLTWHERLGLDALKLLKNPDHRVVFFTVMLFAIPLAAFYPYAPAHLHNLGFDRVSAWMSLGQVTEIIAMFGLGWLLARWRLKWIIGCGLGFGILRYALSSFDGKGWILAGVTLHGCSFALVFITAQIYIDQRVDRGWRARAQALMSLLNGGVGNLFGYLSAGAWFRVCTDANQTRWPVFWGGLAIAVAVVFGYFQIAYHGRGVRPGVTNKPAG